MRNILLSDPVFRMAANQFDRTADFLELSDSIRERCKWPKRAISVSVPVKMDNGETEVFFGHRVQHHLSRGPVKGGLRFHPSVELGEVAALAMWMNWKCALMGLPYGGAKGGVACNPREMSIREIEALTRRFTTEMIPFIGEEIDVMAPDVGTNAQTMAWMTDVYSTHAGRLVPGIVTGKPVTLQGSEGRNQATGHGVAFTSTLALNKIGVSTSNATAIVQGFGNVGSHAARCFDQQYGMKVLGVSDISGAIWNDKGLDIRQLIEYVNMNGSIKDFPESEEIDSNQLLIQKCDVLAPSAIERVITKENAADLQCKVLSEGANGPTTPDADKIIEERGDIFLIPDILCNAGGVTVSYFEWVQNLQRFYWTEQVVITRLETRLADVMERMLRFANEYKASHRVAALAMGVKAVSDVKEQRGLFP